MNVGDYIRKLRIDSDMSQEELGRRIGVQRAAVQKWECGKVQNLKRETIKKLSEIFNVPASSFIFGDDDLPPLDNIFPVSTKRFPILGEIAAGKPKYAVENRESYIVSGSEINADFALRVDGDSMTGARILDGDYVFVRKQEMVDNGEIAVVIIGDEATLKRVYYYPEKQTLILHPENKEYQDIIYIGDELSSVRILGKAVAFQSDVR